MIKIKKLISLTLSTIVLTLNTSNSNALSSIDEIKGVDRYETAAKIASMQSYTTAILVNTDKTLVDGLSASGLAGATNSPILLTKKDSIPSQTLNKLNDVKKVYIIGKENSISNSVEKIIKNKGIATERLGGSDRYTTSYIVAKKISELKKVDKALLINGVKGEPDAMSVASAAARDCAPIILTNGQSIPFSLNNIKSYVIGSTQTMSDKLVSSTSSTRLGGADRFETNKKVIQHFYPNVKEFYLTNGYSLVDALPASKIAINRPIVLVNQNSDKSILKSATKVTAIGGIDSITLQRCLNVINNVVESFASKLKVANQTDQIITVAGTGGYNCKVVLHKKINEAWKEIVSVNGYVGKNGISDSKKEGDGKTPTGVYTFGTGFGVASNPGSKIPYRKVTNYDYWVDDVNSKYYNQWVEINKIKDKDWKSAEHLASYPKAYKYAAVINYNTTNIVKGKGSAIFLHTSTNGPTAGCVSVPESSMVSILKELNSNARIVIGKSMTDIMKY